MDKGDRKIFESFAQGIDLIAANIDATADGIKDRDLKGYLKNQASDLVFLTTDFYDTLHRVQ